MNEGKYGEAISLLHRYISAEPQSAVGYNLRGLCYENRKEYENAVYDFRSALKLEPANKTYQENLDRTVKNWEILLYNRIIGYKREIEINSANPVNYLEIGKCYKNLGKWEEAETWYDKYLKLQEPSSDELIRYSEILAKNNHFSKGEPWLKRFTEKYPDDHRIWSRYGYFTMWLGKKQTAILAFEKALELRPYFKEAMDGYDLARGKGYVYTVNDTTVRFNYGLPVSTSSHQYPIDKYFKKLSKNPNEVQTRILLIQGLIKNNRYDEAGKQLKILSGSDVNKEKLAELKSEFDLQKENYYNSQIRKLEKSYKEKLNDRKIVIDLAELYSLKSEYDKAQKILSDFLQRFPNDDKVLYKLAVIDSWKGDLEKAYSESNKLLQISPKNPDYLLLNSQLSVWLNRNLDRAQTNLENLLRLNLSSYEALLTLASLHLQKNEIVDAQNYLDKAGSLNNNDIELMKLQMRIHQQKELNEEAELYSIVEKARKNLINKECEKAIDFFVKYLKDYKANKEVKRELADAFLCKGDYLSAIEIYDEMISEDPNNFELLKQRAKLYYWSGDYVKAQNEFEKLSLINSDDAEVKLFLGDTYFALEDYSNARKMYDDLLAISPSSFIVNNRLKWFDGSYAGEGFPSYILLSPEAYYFTDNFDFLYSTYGAKLDLGVADFLSIGVGGYSGVLGSDSVTTNISMVKGTLYSKFGKLVSASTGIGATFFPGDESSLLAELSLRIEKQKSYSFSVNFFSMDAAQILYSPFLVQRRLTSNYLLVSGEYITSGSWKFSGSYAFITVSDENKANRLQLRLGKIFQKVFGIGYEYFLYNVKDQTTLYWSPRNFESQSIWADWNLANNSDVKADIGGKIGYIPSDEFVLKEFFGAASFKLSDFLTVQAKLTFSSTLQSDSGYSSTSLIVSAFWNL